MAYMNSDGLLKKYGTEKAIPTLGGDFVTLGETRNAEFTINLATLNATPQVLSDVTFFMQGVFVEQVDVVDEVAAVGGTSFSVGLIGLDRTTVSSNTAFVAALPLASYDSTGEKTVLNKGTTGAGTLIGTTTPVAGYVTAIAAGTFTAGVVKVRIKYRGLPGITR